MISISIVKAPTKYLGSILKDLASQKKCKIEEGHLMFDHVHVLISIFPPNTQCHRLSGLLRVKVPYLLHEPIWGEEKTSPDRVSGQEDIMFQQWVGMRQLCGTTFGIKRKRISE
jgi:REP element-mobilizing transposase RayT